MTTQRKKVLQQAQPVPQKHALDMPDVYAVRLPSRSREAVRGTLEVALRKFKFELHNRGLDKNDFDL